MPRFTACLSALALLVICSSATAQTTTARSFTDINAQSLISQEAAIDKRLDNEVKGVKTRFDKRLANIEGQANVKIARMLNQQRVLSTKLEHQQTYAELRTEQRQAAEKRRRELAAHEAQRQAAQLVRVDISAGLHWPEALQQSGLSADRTQMHAALGGDRRYVAAGNVGNPEEVRRLAAAMFAKVRSQRDELGDQRVIAAKRYLDGLVRAAEQAGATTAAGSLASAE